MAERPGGITRWPLVRGVASLVESLKLGGEALRFSLEQMEKDFAAAATATLSALTLTVLSLVTRADGDEASSTGGGRKAGTWLMAVIAIAFFVALPQGIAAGVNRGLGLGLEVQSPGFQAITGAFKLMVVVTYLLAIRRVPDIRRVFQYHGAEHKTISTYEAGQALTVENARAKTTLHPRCGTTFLVMVALVSILVFTGIGAALPRIHTGSALLDNVVFFFEKLPFLPPIAAVTFEIQRVFARYCTSGPLRALLWPGFLVQKITTAEPDDDQLEIALASLRVTLFRQSELTEGGASGAQANAGEPGLESDVSFPTYAALLAAPRLRAAA